MTNETIVQISSGEVTIIKPKAGQRNKALIKAEEIGNGTASQTVFITELLPKCIKSHPFGTTPISQALDNLEISEYDKISKALGELLSPKEDIEKKSEPQ